MKKFTKFLIAVGIIGAAKYIYDHFEIKVIKMTEPKEEVHDPWDHIYYDNPYNICKILLDKKGCPTIFKFENEKDRDDIFENILEVISYTGRYVFDLAYIFDSLGLIIDDYSKFADYCVDLTNLKFIDEQNKNPIKNCISFGEFVSQ